MAIPPRLRALLDGAPPALPAPLDGLSERWWRLPPRARHLLLAVLVLLAAVGGEARVRVARARWGGPPRTALVATSTGAVGERPAVRPVRLPPALVPDGAPRAVDPGARLALALADGAVLTDDHLAARGPGVALPRGLGVVPLPVPPGPGTVPGARVDVWALTDAPAGSRRIAADRPVVAVGGQDGGRVALVGLSGTETAAAVRALAGGDVLLTHAPP